MSSGALDLIVFGVNQKSSKEISDCDGHEAGGTTVVILGAVVGVG